MIYKVLVNHAMVYTTEREINDETVDIKTTSCGTMSNKGMKTGYSHAMRGVKRSKEGMKKVPRCIERRMIISGVEDRTSVPGQCRAT